MTFFPGAVLGLESSCDETSAALFESGRVVTNVVSSQAALHEKWGGVVPEAAARAHVEAIVPVLQEALQGRRPDAVAVTNRPGLVGALSVGVSAAKALAMLWELPLIAVHHIEGHILSVLAEAPDVAFPHLCLVVSGGHTEIVEVLEPGRYRLLGQTVDDAAGEAFDKGARLFGLGYPGGKAIQDAAAQGNPARYRLPRATTSDPLDLSFSGLKTAVLRLVEKEGPALSVPDAAASLQAAIVDALAQRVLHALDRHPYAGLSLVGGVAANQALRTRLAKEAERRGLPFWVPSPGLCTDNAAMVAVAGSVRLARGERSGFDFDCEAASPLPGQIT
ncbi:MAG: tRNA (adenosine(37)-N6)-threonylcarbamoyltransferase complex transferase subunit TsaD [Fimbriimonadaceae bacterium]|nr:tRNA (adenosine(37)-N6)-threonylcarbamoyltransferase complex transferase subunit TsaD [Fimbriimonadaceae bacterium]QYK54761.1 MAG: tRNA (adenosine(37)-N6)-threonylcarbamoyltransferase complex transferase subunit TsaD [Fimbriimonadaceae bacterium]